MQMVKGSNPMRGINFTTFLKFFLSFWQVLVILVLLSSLMHLEGFGKNGQN